MNRDNNRLIIELDKHRRQVNREKINPTIASADIDTFIPVVNLCAKARAEYIECLLRIADEDEEESRSKKNIDQLRQYRLTYEELVAAANALETVIERGYVDVKGTS